MLGAITGDILGSIYEKIPKYPQRATMEPTDDSILTCACYDWLIGLKKEQLLTLDDEKTQQEVYRRAVRILKKWASYFPEAAGFSKGFTIWSQQKGYQSKVADTNGCIMRSSPISEFAKQRGLSDVQRSILLKLFCEPTHNHPESYQACQEHSDIIMKSYGMSHQEMHYYLLENCIDKINSVDVWVEKAQKAHGFFIWSAKDSLAIALSAIAYSSTWEAMMEFLKTVGGDVDTYAAIAGPIGENIYYDFESHKDIANNVLINSSKANTAKILKVFIQLEKNHRKYNKNTSI